MELKSARTLSSTPSCDREYTEPLKLSMKSSARRRASKLALSDVSLLALVASKPALTEPSQRLMICSSSFSGSSQTTFAMLTDWSSTEPAAASPVVPPPRSSSCPSVSVSASVPCSRLPSCFSMTYSPCW
jgi:hypothetical protein